MSFASTFASRHVILPVIHVESIDQALRNAAIAREASCDGVFLINHGMSYDGLLRIHETVSNECPDWWLGVNCLDLQPIEVFRQVTQDVAGVWVDNARVDERTDEQAAAGEIQDARRASGWKGLYFGGVAFKYQRDVEDLEKASAIATGFMDVVTTSGPGTGKAAERRKIEAIRRGLGDHPLAIASGITPGNIHEYLDLVDCFLVATGISKSFTELDVELVQELVDVTRSYSGGDAAASEPVGPRHVCFVCEWNEGRSPHLELSVRSKLRELDRDIELTSAGLSRGGRISSSRKDYLERLGVPTEEIDSHRAVLFGEEHAQADLILVAELQMKHRLLTAWPELEGKVMTMRGFVEGGTPDEEDLSAAASHVEDSGIHPQDEKQSIYEEHEELAKQVARRLLPADSRSLGSG